MSLIAEADFGLSLLKGAVQNQTTVLSPISVALALSLVHLGARRNSKEQVKNAICGASSHEDCVNHYSTLQNSITQKDHPYLKNWEYCSKPGNMSCVPTELRNQYTSKSVPADAPLLNTNVLVNIANRLFASENFKVKKEYLDELASKYDASLQNLDFDNAEKAAQIVNDFVKAQTAGKIDKLVKKDSFKNDKVALLINAVYFHGRWANPFGEYFNEKNNFFVSDGKAKEVTYMKNVDVTLPYSVNEDFTVVALPFKDRTYSLTIALPKKRFGLTEAVQKLTGERLQELIAGVKYTSVNITLPKFKIDAKHSLNNVLQSIGIVDPFTGNSDLSGISDQGLQLGTVTQKATIDVNEKGTTAAAATAIEMFPVMLPPRATVSFVADSPFLFVLSKDGHILFTGQYYG